MDRKTGECYGPRRRAFVPPQRDVRRRRPALHQSTVCPASNSLASRRGGPIRRRRAFIAFDLKTGKEVWSDNADIFGTWLSYSEKHDVVIEAGRVARDSLLDEPKGMRAYDAKTGRLMLVREDLHRPRHDSRRPPSCKIKALRPLDRQAQDAHRSDHLGVVACGMRAIDDCSGRRRCRCVLYSGAVMMPPATIRLFGAG